MKTIITTLTLVFASFLLNAATYTCSNSPLGGAQYATLNAAYGACAAVGDTILLQNTNIDYSSPGTWSKAIVVIGSGFSDSKTTRLAYSGGSSSITFSTGSNGSEFHGLVFYRYIRINDNVQNLSFNNCYFSSIYGGVTFNATASNIAFNNCVFTNGEGLKVWLTSSSTESVSAIFQNCIFTGFVDGNNGISHSVLFDHCLFMRTTGAHLVELKNTSISNSIFINGAEIADASTSNCTLLNNLHDGAFTMPPALNSGSGNIAGTPSFTTFAGPLYSSNDDYDLLPTTTGTGAAIDGSDVGLHGGNSGFSEALEPSIVPVVTSLIIQNTTVGSGGTLNVDIEARTPLTD